MLGMKQINENGKYECFQHGISGPPRLWEMLNEERMGTRACDVVPRSMRSPNERVVLSKRCTQGYDR